MSRISAIFAFGFLTTINVNAQQQPSLDKLKSKTTSVMAIIAIALKIASIKTSTSGLVSLIKKAMIYLLNLINLRIIFAY